MTFLAPLTKSFFSPSFPTSVSRCAVTELPRIIKAYSKPPSGSQQHLLLPNDRQSNSRIGKKKSSVALANALAKMGPGERATLAAKGGVRFRLDPAHVVPGCIAWMPWAGVIKITHRDFHKAKEGDGVEVIGSTFTGGSNDKKEGATTKKPERPRQRAWNHPVVVLKREGERVWFVAVTSYKSRNLKEKFAKYPEKARKRMLGEVLPIMPANDHPFDEEQGVGGDDYRGLKLAGGVKMRKVGYVKLGTVYAMDWRDLQRFGRESKQRFCLDDESSERLLRVFKAVNPRCARLMHGGKTEVGPRSARRIALSQKPRARPMFATKPVKVGDKAVDKAARKVTALKKVASEVVAARRIPMNVKTAEIAKKPAKGLTEAAGADKVVKGERRARVPKKIAR